jgi:hypothetical protein
MGGLMLHDTLTVTIGANRPYSFLAHFSLVHYGCSHGYGYAGLREG